MSLHLTDAQRARRDAILDFATRELGQGHRERDQQCVFARADWNACAAQGVLGSHVPAAYGGQGLDAVTTVAALEAVGYASRDNGLTLALGGQIWSVQEPILIYGDEDQRRRYLPGLCAGTLVGAHGVTEEQAGSDALALRTTATRVDGGYVLDGTKCFIGMAPEADLALVLARTDPDAGAWGVSAFLVERGADGFTQSAPRLKTGTRTNPLGDLVFERCFVPEANRLGREGIGLSIVTDGFGWERAFIHAGHLGSMQSLFERCVEFASTRTQYGQAIGRYQSVSNRIADMRVRLETSRLLMYKVARMKDASEDAKLECAMANLHIAEALLACATDAVRIHGARGYVEEYEIERELRDALGGVIYAGSSDIQRNLIGRYLGL